MLVYQRRELALSALKSTTVIDTNCKEDNNTVKAKESKDEVRIL
jgi:hypothetical protein